MARAPEVAAAGRDAVAGLRRAPSSSTPRCSSRCRSPARRAPTRSAPSCWPASRTSWSSPSSAPLAGLWWRRRRPSLPRLVADDRAGTVLLGALTVLLAVLGLAHRPAMGEARDDFRAQSAAVRAWVAHRAPEPYRGNIGRADTLEAGTGPLPHVRPGGAGRAARCACSSSPTSRRRPSSATPTSARTAWWPGPTTPGRARRLAVAGAALQRRPSARRDRLLEQLADAREEGAASAP